MCAYSTEGGANLTEELSIWLAHLDSYFLPATALRNISINSVSGTIVKDRARVETFDSLTSSIFHVQ